MKQCPVFSALPGLKVRLLCTYPACVCSVIHLIPDGSHAVGPDAIVFTGVCVIQVWGHWPHGGSVCQGCVCRAQGFALGEYELY